MICRFRLNFSSVRTHSVTLIDHRLFIYQLITRFARQHALLLPHGSLVELGTVLIRHSEKLEGMAEVRLSAMAQLYQNKTVLASSLVCLGSCAAACICHSRPHEGDARNDVFGILKQSYLAVLHWASCYGPAF